MISAQSFRAMTVAPWGGDLIKTPEELLSSPPPVIFYVVKEEFSRGQKLPRLLSISVSDKHLFLVELRWNEFYFETQHLKTIASSDLILFIYTRKIIPWLQVLQ